MRWAAAALYATAIIGFTLLGSASAAPELQGEATPTTTPYPIIDQRTCEGPRLGSVVISDSVWKAQTFVPGVEGGLIQVEIPGTHSSGTTWLHIRRAPNGVPGDADLASTSIQTDSTFHFEEPVLLIPGNMYALVVSNQGGSFAWDYSDSSTCYENESGRPFTSLDSGETWSADVVDFFFTTIMLPDEPAGTPWPTQVPTTAPTATPGEAITEASVFVLSLPTSQPLHDPQLWTERLIRWLKEASMYHGYADRSAPPYLEYQIYSGNVVFDSQIPPRLPNGNYDLTAIYERHDLCDLVQAGDVDEVWIWDPGRGGLPEWVTVGPDWRAPWPWGAQFNPPDCGRRVTTMVFNYDRELDVALESFNHRLEGLFMHHFPCDFWTGSWPWTGWPAECGGLVSDRYGFVARPFVGNDFVGVCGDAHHPPNILDEPDYDFGNPRVVQSICTDWQMDGSAQPTEVSCEDWGCTHLGFHVWWMQNIPGYENSNHDRNGELMPNWWAYLFEDPSHGERTPTPTASATATWVPTLIRVLDQREEICDSTRWNRCIVEFEGREYYTAYSRMRGNRDASTASIGTVDFYPSGNPWSHRWEFRDRGVTVDKGVRYLAASTGNRWRVDLRGGDGPARATLYFSISHASSTPPAQYEIRLGEERISINQSEGGNHWYAIDLEFTGDAAIIMQPLGDYEFGTFMLAGVLLEEGHSPTVTSSPTPSRTATPTPSPTPYPTASASSTPTLTPTAWPSDTPAPTSLATDTPVPTSTPTLSVTPPDGRYTLTASVFLDHRCDGYFKAGIDSYLADVPVVLAFANGASWEERSSEHGMTFFYGFDGTQALSVSVELPDTYRGEPIEACENSPTLRPLSEGDFRFRREYVAFRAQ